MLKRGLGQQAADLLRADILSGKLKPGEQITEEALATHFGVSRGTVRAAVQQLVHEGIIKYEPYKGNYVYPLDAQDVWEIYTLRNTLEAMATRLTAEHITADGKTQLTAALKELKTAVASDSQSAIIDADFALHLTIFQLSGHKRLQAQYKQLENLTRLYMNAHIGYHTSFRDLLQEHIDLVEAILNRDSDTAEKLAKEHNTADGLFLQQQLTPSD